MATSAGAWTERYAAMFGVTPPSATELEQLLALAGVAAHAAERTAAPVSCWLAARAGVSPDRALEVARQLATELEAAPSDEGPHEATSTRSGQE